MESFDDLFGGSNAQEIGAEQIINAPLADLHEFKDHPFKVLDDEKMEEPTENGKVAGVRVMDTNGSGPGAIAGMIVAASPTIVELGKNFYIANRFLDWSAAAALKSYCGFLPILHRSGLSLHKAVGILSEIFCKYLVFCKKNK